MNTKRVVLQPAFVLHTRAYRDTSLLVEVLSMEYGRFTLVARGARGIKSRFKGILAPFLPLLISYSGKGELYSLQQAEVEGASYNLQGDLLLTGFYLNELLVKLLPRHESYFEIYHAYKKTLADLVSSKLPEVELRLFEKSLISNLGYGLQLYLTVDGEPVLDDQNYSFEFGVGINWVEFKCPDSFSGSSLLALHRCGLSTPEEIRDAKRLLRRVLATMLGNKTLKSRELFYR